MSEVTLTLAPSNTVTLSLSGAGGSLTLTTADDALELLLTPFLRGEQGDAGDPGDPGPGLAAGGTTGQLAAKASNADYDTEWVDPPSAGVWGAITGTLTDQADLVAALAGYQPLDSDLTAIAALTTTSYGRAFLALADAAAGRTALGLGTAATAATGDFDAAGAAAAAQAASQPLDSDLTAIAALSTTAFGRALLSLADAAALRTAAGLGTLATQNGTFSGTSSGTNTGDQDLSSYATTAAVAAGYQPLDSDLTAIAALTTTSYGRAFLALADAAAARTALALGTAATAATGDFDAAGAAAAAQAASQPLDSDLTAIAALSTTAFGRALLALADAAALRTAAGLGTLATQNGTFSGTSSGTNTGDQDLSGYQPLDSDLTAFAGLNIAADKLPYGTGSHTLGLADFTAAGRALVDDADAAAQRTTLGLGTLATQSGTFSGTSSGTNTGDQVLWAVAAYTSTGTINDAAPSGMATSSTVRWNGSDCAVVTGIDATGITSSQQITWRNVTTDKLLVFCDEAVTNSTAANRITISNGNSRAHLIAYPGDAVTLEYDGSSSRWVVAAVRCASDNWVRRWMRARANAASTDAQGFTVSAAGTPTAAATDGSGGYITFQARQSIKTTASAGNSCALIVAQFHLIPSSTAGRGGFRASMRFGGSFTPANAGSAYIGVKASLSDIGNNDPSAATNVFGIGTDASQSTFRRIKNDGSGSATVVDLSTGYEWNATNCYEFTVYNAPGGIACCGAIWRTDDLSIVPKAWYDSSDLPASATALSWHMHACNRAAAAAYGFDFMAADFLTPD